MDNLLERVVKALADQIETKGIMTRDQLEGFVSLYTMLQKGTITSQAELRIAELEKKVLSLENSFALQAARRMSAPPSIR